MITSRGIGLVFVAVLIFVLAGVTRVGWLLLFDAVLWGTIVVSAVMPWLASGKLQLRRRTVGWDGKDGDPGPTEGSTVKFEAAIRNIGWLPAIFVTVDYNCEGQPIDPDKELLFIAWLGRRRTISSTARVSYDRRGRYRLPPSKTWTTVPFGLFRRSRRLGEPTELIVLPRVFPIERLYALGYTGGRLAARWLRDQAGRPQALALTSLETHCSMFTGAILPAWPSCR